MTAKKPRLGDCKPDRGAACIIPPIIGWFRIRADGFLLYRIGRAPGWAPFYDFMAWIRPLLRGGK